MHLHPHRYGVRSTRAKPRSTSARRRATSSCCRSRDSDLSASRPRTRRARRRADACPTLRLARLAQLRHPMSVDLYVDTRDRQARRSSSSAASAASTTGATASSAAAAAARANGVAAGGPARRRPARSAPRRASRPCRRNCAGSSTPISARAARRICAGCSRRLAGEIGRPVTPSRLAALPRGFACCPGCGPCRGDRGRDVGRSPVAERDGAAPPLALILVYRSAILGGDGAPVGGAGVATRAPRASRRSPSRCRA